LLIKRAKKKSRKGIGRKQDDLSQRSARKLNGNRAYGAFIFSSVRHAVRTARAARREREREREREKRNGDPTKQEDPIKLPSRPHARGKRVDTLFIITKLLRALVAAAKREAGKNCVRLGDNECPNRASIKARRTPRVSFSRLLTQEYFFHMRQYIVRRNYSGHLPRINPKSQCMRFTKNCKNFIVKHFHDFSFDILEYLIVLLICIFMCVLSLIV